MSDNPHNSSPIGVKTLSIRAAFVALGLAAWFGTQAMIGAQQAGSTKKELIQAGDVLTRGDGLQQMTAPMHGWLTEEKGKRGLWLLLITTAMIDVLGCFLLAWSIFGASVRPFVGLLLLFGLRQICLAVSALPEPAGMFWENPKFPHLFVTYDTANDFFFSGHTAIAVYGAVEVVRFFGKRFRPLTIPLATAAAIFLAGSVIVLRAHYTMDVFAGAVTALLIAFVAHHAAPVCDGWLERIERKDPDKSSCSVTAKNEGAGTASSPDA